MLSTSSARLLALSLAGIAFGQDCSSTCQSFGKDIVNGGTYFQNINSAVDFNLTQYFKGCQNDTAYNILVAPGGDEYYCNNTPLLPSDTTELVTCPIQKDQLTSGNWSLIVLSNNGQCNPIDYIRTFSLSVGPQVTTTVTPTITVVTTSTPVSKVTVTDTTTLTTSAAPFTTTVEGAASATFTIYPFPSVVVETEAIWTYTSTSQEAQVVATTTITEGGHCNVDLAQPAKATAAQAFAASEKVPDPVNTLISVSVLPSGIKGFKQPAAHARRGGSTFAKRVKEVIEVRSVEERFSNNLNKRAPDQPTVTVTDSTASPSTHTSTDVLPTTTITGTTTLIQTITTTPTVTVSEPGAPVEWVTAAPQTETISFWIPVTEVVVTDISSVTLTITSRECGGNGQNTLPTTAPTSTTAGNGFGGNKGVNNGGWNNWGGNSWGGNNWGGNNWGWK